VRKQQAIYTKYSAILVAVDGSNESMNAARHAIGLAKDHGQAICLDSYATSIYTGLVADRVSSFMADEICE
jgi:nucleotide-binding universal stress UspA family protein